MKKRQLKSGVYIAIILISIITIIALYSSNNNLQKEVDCLKNGGIYSTKSTKEGDVFTYCSIIEE